MMLGGIPARVPINRAAPGDYAAMLFLKFLELRRDLGVDVILRCDQCGRYLMNRFGHRNKQFCSRRCAVTQTVRRGRASLYAEKLTRAAKLLAARKPEGDWKTWIDEHTGGRNAVARGAVERISRNWLTHAVNEGFLTEAGKLTAKGKEMIRKGGDHH